MSRENGMAARASRLLDAADDGLRRLLLRASVPAWLPGVLTFAAFWLLVMTRPLAQLAGAPQALRAAGVLALCLPPCFWPFALGVALLIVGLIALCRRP